MRVRIFNSFSASDLQREINEWLAKKEEGWGEHFKVNEIKYSTSAACVKDENEDFIIMYSAMIIY